MPSTARKRYEILVRTRVSPAVLARLRIAFTSIVVPRKTVHRLRVPADRDISEVVRTLTEQHVQILEVRRCRASNAGRPAGERSGGEVIVPFRSATAATPRVRGLSTDAVVLPLVPRPR